MRNKKNEILYLNAFDDEVFNEVSIICKRILRIFKHLSDLERSDVFQTIFSVACDGGTGSDENSYCIMRKPTCPYCGQENVGCWNPTEPPEYIDEDVKPVTHKHWSKLTKQQKYGAIYQAMTDYFSKENSS